MPGKRPTAPNRTSNGSTEAAISARARRTGTVSATPGMNGKSNVTCGGIAIRAAKSSASRIRCRAAGSRTRITTPLTGSASVMGDRVRCRDALALDLETVMDIPSDGVRIAFLAVGKSKIELVEPTDSSTGVARFLESKGEGFHHVCFEVPTLAEALLRLEINGLELIDSAPRRGAEGPVAFLHPRACHGVLVELIEAPGGPSWTTLGFQDASAAG